MKEINKKGWDKISLGEVCKNLNLSEREPLSNGIERYIGLEHIETQNLHVKSWGDVAEGTTFTKKFLKGQVLFGKRRAYLKKAALAKFDGICSGDILVFEANDKILNKKLLPFLVSSDRFFDFAVQTSAGSLSPRTKFQDLAKFEFLLPPKEQQSKLADLLWSGDTMIEYRKKMGEKLNQVYDCLKFASFFLEPQNKRYKEMSVGEIAPLQRGFDLPNGKIIEGEYQVGYSNGFSKSHNDYRVEGPGVFTGRSGTIGNVFYSNEKYWPHNTTLWVTNFNDNFPKYIYHLYSSLNFENHSAGTGVPTLNRNDIHKIKVRIPPKNIQIQIAEKLDSMASQINAFKKNLEISKQIQKQLINQIFGGYLHI
ncbi:MAG: restriction endonuclease subunit S [Nitrosopumilus sp.]|nr:restriction endonuclease subunit S [Nitrosopumilus sp.]MBA3971741.1 restriction endonuclease subunit S [Bacteroidota bacterium]